MTGIEPGSDGPGAGAEQERARATLRASPWEHRTKAGGVAGPIAGRPILWKWWLFAGGLSLAIWAGIIALVM